LFIEKLVTKIWEPVTKEYLEAYNESMKFSAEELFELHSKNRMRYYQYPGVNMNMLPSAGCPYRFKNGVLAGCSMCDYQSEQAKAQGSLLALRKKNPELYAKAIKTAFQNSRGIGAEPNLFELISGYDTLDANEFPDEVYDQLYSNNELFKGKPFKYIVETRASSINSGKLNLLKSKLGNRLRVSIEFGVEVGDQWIRNHWLNKDILDKEIIDAVACIHEVGYKATGDVIIGIPGLTEQQSIKLFVDTVTWLDSLGIDDIVSLPLNRKEYTLQGLMYKQLKDNPRLKEVGIAQEEHTGLPWLFTVVEALYQAITARPELAKKINIAQLSSSLNSVKNDICYNQSRDCKCVENITSALQQFHIKKDISILEDLRNSFEKDQCYLEYKELLAKQENSGDIPETISLIGVEMAKILWPGDEDILNELEYECNNKGEGSVT
jgi:radical SAM enzyme (TIGR01210 family)